MHMGMLKLLMLDIDGTMTEKDQSMNEKTLTALREVKKRNRDLNICLISGNVLPVMIGIMNITGIGDSLMAENGGLLYHAKSITKYFDSVAPKNALEKLKEDHGAVEFITNRWRETSLSFILDGVHDFSPYEKQFNVKIEDSGYAKHILNNGQGKGFATRKLMEIYGCSPEEVIACGDGENDISMIKIAEYSGVPNNAIDELKVSASYVSDKPYGEGLIDIFRHFSLI